MSDEEKTVNLIIASHGGMAEATLRSAEQIVGPVESAQVVTMSFSMNLDDLEKEFRTAISNLNEDEGIMILVDLFGGSCSNVAARLYKEFSEKGRKFAVLAGFNLPMVVEFACSTQRGDLLQITEKISTAGQNACINVGNKLDALAAKKITK
ncbi:MAG: PTS sugar transporter subunit IIA [Candidatus Lindowbacteria bacterium]|nr:PTS sugar transporter subunit IIA [Candidatus Lindowbacteria bacterium]